MNELSQLGPLTALPHDRGSQSPYHLETPWGASGTLLSLGDNQAPSGPGFWEPRSPVSRVSSGSRPWTGGRQAGQSGREPGSRSLTPQAHSQRPAIPRAAREPGPRLACVPCVVQDEWWEGVSQSSQDHPVGIGGQTGRRGSSCMRSEEKRPNHCSARLPTHLVLLSTPLLADPTLLFWVPGW